MAAATGAIDQSGQRFTISGRSTSSQANTPAAFASLAALRSESQWNVSAT